MKFLKLVIKFFVCFIIFILSILVIDYIRINVSYSINKDKYIESFDIQGNTNHYIPQGLAYSSLYNVVLQTSYNKEHDVSMLYITDFKSGKLLKSLKLIDINDKDNMKHVGGITTDNNTVWITNDYEVDEFSLDEIINHQWFIKTPSLRPFLKGTHHIDKTKLKVHLIKSNDEIGNSRRNILVKLIRNDENSFKETNINTDIKNKNSILTK